MTTNNRLDLRDVIEGLQNQDVSVYTSSPVPLGGKLTFSNDKILRLTVSSSAGETYVYINAEDVIAIVSSLRIS